jgi:putative phosphoesterase
MKLALLSDTHGFLRPEIFPLLEGVDRILHAGDVGTPSLLAELEAVAPVTAVWGNADGFDLRRRLPEVARNRWEGHTVVVVHGHQLGIPTPEALAEAHADASLVVFGHTHVPVIREVGRVLVVNPGSCGKKLKGYPPCVAHVTLGPDGVRAALAEVETGKT